MLPRLPRRLSFFFLNSAKVFLATLILTSGSWAGPKYQGLHAFGAGKDGTILWGSLTLDGKGNLYGTTAGGGAHGYGTVFQLIPKPDGRWEEVILYSFHDPYKSNDGGTPSASLIFDGAGNLYGTTTVGGGSYTDGTVFELSPGTHNWSETVIHRFGHNDKASGPWGGVIMDGSGNLYGVGGCAFELSPEAGGRWNEHILHCFPAFDGDGWGELDRPIMGAAGNLYGTTEHGGTSKLCGGGCGTVYELQRTSGGWKEHILHDFGTGGDDMAFPGVGALVLDSAGNLYGTAGGGASRAGVVFRVNRSPDGHWKTTIQYAFTGGANGDQPGAGVVLDKAGNLYGTTIAGGDPNCGCGVVYKLAPQANGKWKYTLLHTFIGSDGAQPDANLILDDKGNLYGTTAIGGAAGAGVAFELIP